ncbi:leucine-rich repeat-containing protein 69 [Nematolebias whitei]|uniref:leucine-rich repeat-containing protein 69 n=1 Tax=Nematolebias whitei TaxID=451745 RepID=UPI0018990CF9|nr:leucine-rich repeat-containing protein 69 [Nematolebias whitei]
MAYRSSTVNKLVIRALYGKSTSLNLNSRSVFSVPECVSRLTNLSVLLLRNNFITGLPPQLLSLQQLSILNLGNNALKEVPLVLNRLKSLKKLYLFSNQIAAVPPGVIGHLENLVVLNLNHNNIQRLPSDIKSLRKLQHLSLQNNKLEELPREVGYLTKLRELNLTFNKLSWLPLQLYQCRELTKLHAARNQLTSLPDGIVALDKLQVLDVAGNRLSMFPVEFHLLPLKELHCESNRLVKREPVLSLPNPDVLSLKELVARFVLQEDQNKFSLVHMMLPRYPDVSALLTSSSSCAFCQHPFLTTRLECVHFVNLKKDMNLRSSLTVPVRAFLCSHKCLNSDGHSYYGVVTNKMKVH